MAWIERHWYHNGPVAFALWPLSLAYCALARWRRKRLSRQVKVPARGVPVIVVGNITVGGTGKTPVVIWLADYLKVHGYRPGIVSRGYGGRDLRTPQQVTSNSDAREVGDEALLIARRTACPTWVCADRTAAMDALLRDERISVVISDDGLQHYRMHRDIEIAMIDGARRFGNGLCLPAGPLREGTARLDEVEFRLVSGALADDGEFAVEYSGDELVNLQNPSRRILLADLKGSAVHAVAGLGNPARFFRRLEDAGLRITRHDHPDHHQYRREDLDFTDHQPIVMTEKDAVKCALLANPRIWYLPITARPDPQFAPLFLKHLKDIERGQKAARYLGLPGDQRPFGL
ncbi:MAG: tetraacyldisaccharide 4'-kinase [Thiotrichales bacterium]